MMLIISFVLVTLSFILTLRLLKEAATAHRTNKHDKGLGKHTAEVFFARELTKKAADFDLSSKNHYSLENNPEKHQAPHGEYLYSSINYYSMNYNRSQKRDTSSMPDEDMYDSEKPSLGDERDSSIIHPPFSRTFH